MTRDRVLAFMAALRMATGHTEAAEVYLVPLYSCAALGARQGES